MTSPSRRKVLVTGATGLIGRHVLSVLDDGYDVHAVSRTRGPAGEDVTWLTRDLGVPGAAREVVAEVEPELVIHLAGAVRGDRSLEAVPVTLTTNLVATVELLEAVTRAGVDRIVVSGSLLEEPASGDPMSVPPSPYGASRWASSAYARMFHALFETPVIILRPSYAYGPGQESTKLVPYVIEHLLRGDRPSLASGARRLDFVFAEDVARAYVAAATSSTGIGETIDIGCGRLTRVADVVESIARRLGRSVGEVQFGGQADRALEQEIEVDTESATRILGWKATTSLEDGLDRTVAWHTAQAGR